MIFHRSVPVRLLRDYTGYRQLLRKDFRFRCAYCLVQEYFVGGEAGCCIDHHRPVNGLNARPDLVSEYTNLYWCCRECNENKGDSWPSQEDYAANIRFLDPCEPEDDHELHWRILQNGMIEPLTSIGRYTVRHLKLWRPFLQYHRALLLRLQDEIHSLEQLLDAKGLTAVRRKLIIDRLKEINRWLEPPVFDRPRD
jgi:hypothetical protein